MSLLIEIYLTLLVISAGFLGGCHFQLANSLYVDELPNDRMGLLFKAVVEATEEAIYNSMFMAETIKGRDGHVSEAIPIDETIGILEKYNAISREERE